MPLYNQATTLNSGRGNFAPSVSYYAGIKAPDQPAIHLPRQDASFNIDLSSIGNAMIAAKESETKLGLAAVEMEENLRNAERDRQFKLDLTTLQQDREDARLEKTLANQMDIAKLNNATELQKAMISKSKQKKEDNLAAAEIALLNDEGLNQAFLDYSADPSKRELEYMTKLNNTISRIATEYGVLPSKLQTVASNANFSKGIGSSIERDMTVSKKVVEDAYNEDKALAQTLNPGLYSTNPDAAMSQVTGFKQRTAQVRGWQSLREVPGQSQHIIDFANHQIKSDVKNVALDIAIAASTAAQNELGTRTLTNPGQYLETTKQITAAEIVASTGLGYGEVRPLVDTAYAEGGLNSTVNSIYSEAGNNAQYIQKLLQYTKDTGELDILQNGPEFAKTALIVGNIPLFNSLDPETKSMYSQIVSSALFGSVRPYSSENGERGWIYSYKGREVRYTDEEINQLGKSLGLDVRKPDQIVAFVGSQILSNGGLKSGVDNGTILQQDAYPIYNNTVKNVTGNKDGKTGLDAVKLTVEEEKQLRKNVTSCSANDICTSEHLMSNIDVFKKGTSEYNSALQIARGYEAEERLGKFLSTSEEATFNDAVNYIKGVSNIKGEDAAKFFGADYSKDPDKWDHYDLKNTKIYYTIEDNKVALKYYQDGWFKTGGTELQKRLDLVSNTLVAAGIPVEGQIAFYNNHLGEVLDTSIKDESTWNKVATKAQEVVFDTAAKADTELLSWMTSENDIKNIEGLKVDEAAFLSGWFAQEDPELARQAEQEWINKLDQLGKEDYGALKQGLYTATTLAVRGLTEVARSIYGVGETTVEQMTEAFLDFNDWLRNLKGANLNSNQISTINKVAKQIIKESKKQNRVLTADEAFDLFMNKPLEVTIEK